MGKKLPTLLLPLLLSSSAAHASDFGCKVLLCLANPAANGGPLAIAECVAPIRQLYRDLIKGRPFPMCEMSGTGREGTHARLVEDPYDPCPDQLRPARRLSYVAQGRRQLGVDGNVSNIEVIGTVGVSELGSSDGTVGPRACVGTWIGTASALAGPDGVSVSVYDVVQWQAPQPARAIDLYVDGVFRQRVRF